MTSITLRSSSDQIACDTIDDMVNTFLPLPSFRASARMLDRARLGRQRTEVVMILRALHTGEGYVNHPATKMWAGHELALTSYGLHVCAEWVRRGYTDNQAEWMRDLWPFYQPADLMLTRTQLRERDELPWWFGWRAFHEAHRSNLIRKAEHWYFPRIAEHMQPPEPNLPYVWPRAEFRQFKRQHSKDSQYYVRL